MTTKIVTTENLSVYPTVYNHSQIIQEYAGTLDFMPWSAIAEIVGIHKLYELCKDANTHAKIRVCNSVISKYNKQNKTRLTFECVKTLTPTFGIEGLLYDPIVHTNDLAKFKEAAARTYVQGVSFNSSNSDYKSLEFIMSLIDFDKEGIETVLVYFPIEADDSIRGYWTLYKSPFYDKNYKLKNSFCSISTRSPIDIEVDDYVQNSYSLPPNEEASFHMQDILKSQAEIFFKQNTGRINL